MPVLHRDALEASPLADLHAIASELGIDGFRRLRKADLIDRILRDSGGEAAAPRGRARTTADAVARRRGRRRDRGRGGRGGRRAAPAPARHPRRPRPVGPRRAPIATGATAATTSRPSRRARTTRPIEGVVELLGNGSGFVRVSPPEPSDDDVYVSAAQVRRCELVSGDRVSGPVRKPRRSERYPSLVRVDTINGAPAEEVAEGTPYDELPCAFPSERLRARLRRPDAEGDRVADPDRTRLARDHHRRGARGQDRDAASPRRGAGRRRGPRAQPRAHRRAPGGGRRVEGRIAGPRGRAHAGRRVRRAGPGGRARDRDRPAHRRPRRPRRRARRHARRDRARRRPPRAGRGARHRRRRLADGDRHRRQRRSAARRRSSASTPARTAARNFPALDLAASGTLRPELLVGDAGANAIAAARAEAG